MKYFPALTQLLPRSPELIEIPQKSQQKGEPSGFHVVSPLIEQFPRTVCARLRVSGRNVCLVSKEGLSARPF